MLWVSMREVFTAETQAENQAQLCVFTKIFFKGTKEKTETSKPEHTAVELEELSFLLVQFICIVTFSKGGQMAGQVLQRYF